MRLSLTSLLVALVLAPNAWSLTTTSVSFQQGANGYTDGQDMRISVTGGTRDGTNGNTVTNYLIDGYAPDDLTTGAYDPSPDEEELIRFANIFGSNAGQIPLGATIIDAQMTYKTFDTGTTPPSGGPWGVAALNQPFTTATRYADFPSPAGATLNSPTLNGPLPPGRGAWFEDGTDNPAHPGVPYSTRAVGAFAGPQSA